MERKGLVGNNALFIYKDNSRIVQCFGVILEEDSLFFKVQTDKNLLLIPKTAVLKVKIRQGEKNANSF